MDGKNASVKRVTFNERFQRRFLAAYVQRMSLNNYRSVTTITVLSSLSYHRYCETRKERAKVPSPARFAYSIANNYFLADAHALILSFKNLRMIGIMRSEDGERETKAKFDISMRHR